MLSRILRQRLMLQQQLQLHKLCVISSQANQRGFAGKSKINEEQIDSEIKYQREHPDKALGKDKAHLTSDQTDYPKSDGQHTQYMSMGSSGSGNPDPSERERRKLHHISNQDPEFEPVDRMKIMHSGEKSSPIPETEKTNDKFDQKGTFDQQRTQSIYQESSGGKDYKPQEYMGGGTEKTNPNAHTNEYKTYTKENYQNLNARNVGNPTPSQGGKYEQKTGQFGLYSQNADMAEGGKVHSYLQDNWKKDIQEGSGMHDTRTMQNTVEHDESVQNIGQRQDFSKRVQTQQQQEAQDAQQKPKQFGGKQVDDRNVRESDTPNTQDQGSNVR
eukprot:403362599